MIPWLVAALLWGLALGLAAALVRSGARGSRRQTAWFDLAKEYPER